MDPLLKKTLEEHLGMFLLALFLSVISCFLAWYRGYFKLPSFKKSDVELNLYHVLGAFLIYFFSSWFFAREALHWVLDLIPLDIKDHLLQEMDALRGWVNLGVMVLIFVFLMVYLRLMERKAAQTVFGVGSYGGLGPKFYNFSIGVLTWVISFPLVVAVSQLSNVILTLLKLDVQEQVAVLFLKSTMNNPVVFGLTCFLVVLLIPAIEELLFRGFLQNLFAKYLGRPWAIFVSSLIFSGFHFSVSQSWGNLEIIASLFVLSCFLGFVYFRQKSIFASIGLHASFNGVNVLLMSLSKGG